jgi:hypothetical protein
VPATLAALGDATKPAVLGAHGAWGPRVWAPLTSAGRCAAGCCSRATAARPDFAAGDAKLLAALATQATAFLDVARLHRRALAQERLERELQLAFEVQSRLMPRGAASREGWDVAAHWRPAREVSGDFYDVLDVGDELGLVVADVADKGMPAALFMAVVRSLLRASAGPDRSPAEAVAQTNRWACRDAADGTFVTLWYGQFRRDGSLRYVNGGHNPPFLVRADGGVERLTRTGILVGWDPDVAFGEAERAARPGRPAPRVHRRRHGGARARRRGVRRGAVAAGGDGGAPGRRRRRSSTRCAATWTRSRRRRPVRRRDAGGRAARRTRPPVTRRTVCSPAPAQRPRPRACTARGAAASPHAWWRCTNREGPRCPSCSSPTTSPTSVCSSRRRSKRWRTTGWSCSSSPTGRRRSTGSASSGPTWCSWT